MRRGSRWPINFWPLRPLHGIEIQQISEQIERLPATLILTPFATAACALSRAFMCLKCVGEDNVIDPLHRWLK